MIYIKNLKYVLVLILILFLTACNTNYNYLYKIEGNNLIVIIDDVEYDLGEVDVTCIDLNCENAYDAYKSLYPEYMGTKEQFKEDVIKSRLYYGEALLTVTFNINGNIKEDLFFRGDNLIFPRVSSKEYIIQGWTYQGREIDESFIVEDDITIDAIIKKYLNISVTVEGGGTAQVNKTRVFKGESLKLIYNAFIGYKFSYIAYNGEKINLLDDDTFLVTDDENVDIVVVFDFDELSMPIMSIELDTSLDQVDQIDYVNAKMSISNTDSKYEISDLNFLFRGRGNWSWAKEKKAIE